MVHLAGINRDSPKALDDGNDALAQQLIDHLERTERPPVVVYANSVQSSSDSSYGRGKRRAGEVLAAWAERRGARYVDVVLPNIYGEWGRPDYNSFIATFCAGLADDRLPEVVDDRSIELVHAQDAVAALALEMTGPTGVYRVHCTGTSHTVSEVLRRLTALADEYRSGQLPDLSDPFDLRLFNTYRSHLYPGHFPLQLYPNADERGVFVEIARSTGSACQSSFSSTRPGIIRGQHFHLRKVERFVVLRGTARIRLRPLWSDQVWSYDVDSDQPVAIDMPTLVTHDITNVGSGELLTYFWISELYDPSDTDTFPDAVS